MAQNAVKVIKVNVSFFIQRRFYIGRGTRSTTNRARKEIIDWRALSGVCARSERLSGILECFWKFRVALVRAIITFPNQTVRQRKIA